jgi:hypothetical protein
MNVSGFRVDIFVGGERMIERNGVVEVPFGGEYEVHLAGPYDGLRSVAHVYIDGIDVTPNGLVVPAHGVTTVLKRPTRGSTVKFKFAALESEAAHAAGKGGPDDGTKGLVKVTFQREKPRPQRFFHVAKGFSFSDRGLVGEHCIPGSVFRSCSAQPTSQGLSGGVTVEGSRSDQQFTSVNMDVEEFMADTIEFKLMGFLPHSSASCLPPTRPPQQARYCHYCGYELSPLRQTCGRCGGLR